MKSSIVTIPIQRVFKTGTAGADTLSREQDLVAVEEPLQIRLRTLGQDAYDLAITMRTPGHDEELAVGFLFSEGIVNRQEDLAGIDTAENSVTITLSADAAPDLRAQTRQFYLTSSCGVCGKASVDSLLAAGCTSPDRNRPIVSAAIIRTLPDVLRETQAVFDRTGGLHAAGLFDSSGKLLLMREDVGRHNAVDKLVGRSLLDGRVPLENSVLMLSGRISFELVQKALMAGLGVIAAVGAPSSLAVETARRFGITLAGFVRDGRFNIYSGDARIIK